MSDDLRPPVTEQGTPEEVATAPMVTSAPVVEYGEYDVDADVGNVPGLLIWIFVLVLLWGIFAWVPFFGGAPGGQW